MPPINKLVAEAIGTGWLVFAGLGAAVYAAGVPAVGIGYLGVALAVGLTVMTMAFAIGHISGCHLNPAVSVGLVIAGRFSAKELPGYIIAQVIGGTIAAGLMFFIATQQEGATIEAIEAGGFACNGYGQHSPHNYSLMAGFLAETVLTAMFLVIILGATDRRAPAGFAPIAIGLGLTLIHLVGIPLTNLSVNPARSTATAVFGPTWALGQLWLFWVAPILGGIVGAAIYKIIAAEPKPANAG